jgi:hypothetical protein
MFFYILKLKIVLSVYVQFDINFRHVRYVGMTFVVNVLFHMSKGDSFFLPWNCGNKEEWICGNIGLDVSEILQNFEGFFCRFFDGGFPGLIKLMCEEVFS